jgi:hypothetical protein
MATDLYRLVYYSRNRIQKADADFQAEVESILRVSQANNAEAKVTGALIFNNGVFAQVLEGGRADVETTFERIQRDDRHDDVQVLSFEPEAERRFASWSMAFIGRSKRHLDLFGHLAQASGFEAKRLQGERVLEIMHTIALEDEIAAS